MFIKPKVREIITNIIIVKHNIGKISGLFFLLKILCKTKYFPTFFNHLVKLLKLLKTV